MVTATNHTREKRPGIQCFIIFKYYLQEFLVFIYPKMYIKAQKSHRAEEILACFQRALGLRSLFKKIAIGNKSHFQVSIWPAEMRPPI